MPPRRSKRTSSQAAAAAAEEEEEATVSLSLVETQNEPETQTEVERPSPAKRARRSSRRERNTATQEEEDKGKASASAEPTKKRRRASVSLNEADISVADVFAEEEEEEEEEGDDSSKADGKADADSSPAAASRSTARKGKASTAPKALFEIISTSKTQPSAIAVAADEWIRGYEKDRPKAILELVNFMIVSSGCTDRVISRKEYDATSSAEDLLSSVTTVKFMKSGEGLYPLSKPGAPGRAFRSHFNDLWSKIFQKIPNRVLYERELFDTLFDWLLAFAHSKARGFRHTGTAAAFQIVHALCKVAVRVKKEKDVVDRQYAIESKRSKTSARAKALLSKQSELTDRLEILRTFMVDDIFNLIFMRRYRDTALEIRILCVEMLGVWMEVYRDEFLDNNYLKYFYWSLHDREPAVRGASLSALEPLLREAAAESREAEFSGQTTKRGRRSSQSSQSQSQSQSQAQLIAEADGKTVLEGLDGSPSFVDRVKPRIIEMTRDVNADIAGAALRAATYLATMRKLEIADRPSLNILLTCADAAVRAEAAQFVDTYLFQSIVPESIANPDVLPHASLRTLLELVESSLTPSFPNYAVDALWGKLSCLTNWSAMTDLLDADETKTTDPSRRELDPSQQVLLARLINACAARATGFSIVDSSSVAPAPDAESTRENLAKHFAHRLPSLIERFAGEPAVLEELLGLPRYFSLHHFSAQRQRSVLKNLIKGIVASFRRHTSESLLSTTAETLGLLVAGLDAGASDTLDSALTLLVTDLLADVTSTCALQSAVVSRKARSSDQSPYQALEIALLRTLQLSMRIDLDAYSSQSSFGVISAATRTVKSADSADEHADAAHVLTLKLVAVLCAHRIRAFSKEKTSTDLTGVLNEQAKWLCAELADALDVFGGRSTPKAESSAIPSSCHFGGAYDDTFATCIDTLILFSPASPVAGVAIVADSALQESLISGFERRCVELAEFCSSSSNSAAIEAAEETATLYLQNVSKALGYDVLGRRYAARVVTRYLHHGKAFEEHMKEFLRHLRERAPHDFWKVIIGAMQLSFDSWLEFANNDEEEASQSLRDFGKLTSRLVLMFGVGHTTAALAPLLFQVISEGVLAVVSGIAEHPSERQLRWKFVSEGLSRFVAKLPVQHNGVGANKLLKFSELQPEQAGINMRGSVNGYNPDDVDWYLFLASLERVAKTQGATLDEPNRFAGISKTLGGAQATKSKRETKKASKAKAKKSTAPKAATNKKSVLSSRRNPLRSVKEMVPEGDSIETDYRSDGSESAAESVVTPRRAGRRGSKRAASASSEEVDDVPSSPEPRRTKRAR